MPHDRIATSSRLFGPTSSESHRRRLIGRRAHQGDRHARDRPVDAGGATTRIGSPSRLGGDLRYDEAQAATTDRPRPPARALTGDAVRRAEPELQRPPWLRSWCAASRGGVDTTSTSTRAAANVELLQRSGAEVLFVHSTPGAGRRLSAALPDPEPSSASTVRTPPYPPWPAWSEGQPAPARPRRGFEAIGCGARPAGRRGREITGG